MPITNNLPCNHVTLEVEPQVFDRFIRRRQFFEEVIRDNLDQGCPDRIQLLFECKLTKRISGRFRIRVIQDGVHPSLHIHYKKSHVKQYFKENRVLRTETTINEFFLNPVSSDQHPASWGN